MLWFHVPQSQSAKVPKSPNSQVPNSRSPAESPNPRGTNPEVPKLSESRSPHKSRSPKALKVSKPQSHKPGSSKVQKIQSSEVQRLKRKYQIRFAPGCWLSEGRRPGAPLFTSLLGSNPLIWCPGRVHRRARFHGRVPSLGPRGPTDCRTF